MPFRQKLAEITRIEEGLLPSSYQIIGHVLLIKFMHIRKLGEKKKVAAAILELLPYVKTVCEIVKVESEFRTPKLRKLAGNGTITVHKEHGISYKLDAAKIMFSKGNLFERQRLAGVAKPHETVVDMFAGIGYFSLGLASHVRKIYAIEKNPIAYGYLQNNIKLNKAINIEAILGDNRKVALDRVADRVVMGYFPHTEKFLPAALTMLKSKGIIHFHNVYKEAELWHKPMSHLDRMGVNYKILGKKKVKSVAPRTYHVVLDVLIDKHKKLNL